MSAANGLHPDQHRDVALAALRRKYRACADASRPAGQAASAPAVGDAAADRDRVGHRRLRSCCSVWSSSTARSRARCSACRAGRSGRSTRSPISANPAGSCGRSACMFLALAALPAPATRVSQAVLAAAMVRVGFLFTAIALPGLFDAIIKRMIGRARPMVLAGHVDPFLFAPFIWRADYASLPSGHATTAFSVLVAFGCLWPRARTVLLLYAVAIALSRILVLGAFPLRRDRRRRGRHRGRAAGALLFRAAPARLLGRAGRHAACASGALAQAHESGCPRAIGPIRSARACRPTEPLKPMSTNEPAVSVVVPVRNEAGNIAPLVAEIAAALDGQWAVRGGLCRRRLERRHRGRACRGWRRNMPGCAACGTRHSCGQSAAVRTRR